MARTQRSKNPCQTSIHPGQSLTTSNRGHLGKWWFSEGIFPRMAVKISLRLGGGFKHVLFSSLFGKMLQFDEHIFQMGWFNHQPTRRIYNFRCPDPSPWIELSSNFNLPISHHGIGGSLDVPTLTLAVVTTFHTALAKSADTATKVRSSPRICFPQKGREGLGSHRNTEIWLFPGCVGRRVPV